MAPLIDIVFLLICFYLLVAQLISTQSDPAVQLPTMASPLAAREQPAELVINLRDDGTVIVNNQPLSPDALRDVLSTSLAKADGSLRVVIRADRRQTYRRLHEIMALCRDLDVRQVIMVPDARFALVAFKDYGDDYGPEAVHAMSLTDDGEAVRPFLRKIRAGGGGDDPEPIDEALAVAVHPTRLGWRRTPRRVILLVSDAPIHPSGRKRALQAARQFRRQGGHIDTIDVTVREDQAGTVLADLQRIAAEGGGAAFPLDSEKAFWRHLIISLFGEQYAQDVEMIVERVVGTE